MLTWCDTSWQIYPGLNVEQLVNKKSIRRSQSVKHLLRTWKYFICTKKFKLHGYHYFRTLKNKTFTVKTSTFGLFVLAQMNISGILVKSYNLGLKCNKNSACRTNVQNILLPHKNILWIPNKISRNAEIFEFF